MRGIKYIAYNDHSGYGVAAARAMRGLIEAGVPLTWTPLVPGIPFQPHQRWAEADMDQAVAALRRVRAEPNPALADHIARHYNRPAVTRRLLEALAAHVH